jgi:hypothetical protein
MTKSVVTGRVAMGVDASLTGTGLVAVPFDWRLDWSKIARMKLGLGLEKNASELVRVRRLDVICTRMMEFAREHAVTDVFMEQYAFSSKTAHSHALGEIGGNLKRDIVMGLGLPLTVVPPATARTLLGKFSARAKKGQPKPAKVKDQVATVLRRAGLPSDWDADLTDAWVCVNWGLSGIEGADAIILREAK